MIVDFSHLINEKISAYTKETMPLIEKVADVEKDYYEERKLTIFTHTGTHVDSPRHILKKGRYLDEYSMDELQGSAIILDFQGYSNREIKLEDILIYDREVKNNEFIFINTGWSKYFGEDKYLKDYPTLSKEASEYISKIKSIKGVGIDCISIDRYDNLINHNIFLKNGIIIVENLNNLSKMVGSFKLYIAPLYIENSDGAPARVFGVKE